MSLVSYDAVLTVREFTFNKKRPRNEKATLTHQSKRRTKFTRIDGFRLVFIETESTLLIDLTFIIATVASAEDKLIHNDFHGPFELSDITPKNMQKWPYYRYVSMNRDESACVGQLRLLLIPGVEAQLAVELFFEQLQHLNSLGMMTIARDCLRFTSVIVQLQWDLIQTKDAKRPG